MPSASASSPQSIANEYNGNARFATTNWLGCHVVPSSPLAGPTKVSSAKPDVLQREPASRAIENEFEKEKPLLEKRLLNFSKN